MERDDFDSSILIVVSIDVLGSRFFLGLVVEARPVARPFRKVCTKPFTLLQAVDILRVIPDQPPAVAEGSDELMGGCC